MLSNDLISVQSTDTPGVPSDNSIVGLFVGLSSHDLRVAAAAASNQAIFRISTEVDTAEQALSLLRAYSGDPGKLRLVLCDAHLDAETLRTLFGEIKKTYAGTTLLLYAPAFDAAHKAKAVELRADDYLYDALGLSSIIDRIQFLVDLRTNPPTPTEVPSGSFRRHWKKRLLDVCVASLLLLLLSPLLILIIVLIKLESPGSAFFVAQRVGYNYTIFDFYKFRTMHIGADSQREKLKHLNAYYSSNRPVSKEPFFFKVKNDPRVTKVGRILRKTSLDELPQLLNVLKGDMSLVGNRPLPLDEAASLTKDEWAARFLAPSGMTGLWQISKRKQSMTVAERINLDLTYRENMSLRTDLKILLKTLPGMLQQD